MADPRRTYAYLCASLHSGAGPEAWAGVERAAEALQVNVVAFPGGRLGSRDDFESLRNRVFDLVAEGPFDGVLSWASSLGGVPGADLEAFHRRFEPLPLVTLTHPLPGHPCVQFDVTTGMEALVDHLVTVHGYRSIAFVRGPEAHVSARARLEAFRGRMRHHGLTCHEALVTSPRGWDHGAEASAELLDTRGLTPGRDFEALVAASDLLAFAVLKDLQRRGFRVPSDVAVVGFNDSPESRVAVPTLTTVHLPFADQAADGLAALDALCRGAPSEGVRPLATQLVCRQSCSCRSPEVAQASSLGQPRFDALGFSDAELRAWVNPLADALTQSDPDHRDHQFLERLDRVLERVTPVPVPRWQSVLNELRRGATLDRRLEDLFSQARILVAEASLREARFQEWRRHQKAEEVRQLARALQGALDPPRLAEVVVRKLPELGFRGGWWVENDGSSRRGRLLGAFGDKGRVPLPPGGWEFPMDTLLPVGTAPNRRATLVVEPLSYRDRYLGTLVLEAGPDAKELFEEVRSVVTGALPAAYPRATGPGVQSLFSPAALVSAEFRCDGLALPWALGNPDDFRVWIRSRAKGTVRLGGQGWELTTEAGSTVFEYPTLGGLPSSPEGDRLLVLATSPPAWMADVEAATALEPLLVDPEFRFEAFAGLRPALIAVDLGSSDALLRTLALLATQPDWAGVPVLAWGGSGTGPAHRGLAGVLPRRLEPRGRRLLWVGPVPDGLRGNVSSVETPVQAIPVLQQEWFDRLVTPSGGVGLTGLDLVDFVSSDHELDHVRTLVLVEADLATADWDRLTNQPRVSVRVASLGTAAHEVEFAEQWAARTSPASGRVKRALSWLMAHHAQDVTRWQLAEHVSVSEDHLTREFRRELGHTPWEFLTEYRVLKACRALEEGAKALPAVAQGVGYRDYNYFCRVFRKHTGSTPQQYRQAFSR